MTGILKTANKALRAMRFIAPAAVLLGMLASASSAKGMEGCPDFVESCRCPLGCTLGYCERSCSPIFGTDAYCHNLCSACQCQAWASVPGRGLLKLLQCMIPSASAEESQAAAPEGRREITNPDGDFVIIPKAEAKRLGDENAGVGIAIRQSSGSFIVSGIETEGPAAKAGLEPGDEIVQVDGKATRGGSLKAVAEWIRGRPGTMVSLLVRGKKGKDRKVPLVRISRDAFHRAEKMLVTAKSVPTSEFKGAACPKVHDGCNFLVTEDGACIYTCRSSK